MQKLDNVIPFPTPAKREELRMKVNYDTGFISTDTYSMDGPGRVEIPASYILYHTPTIKEMQADPLLFIRAIYSSDIHPWQEDVVAEMVRYISEPVRSTTDVWNDMRNLPMTGTCKYREELIAELRGDVKRKWWQFWRKS